MPEGTIEVELIRGHDLKDVEFIGKSDPYAIISVGHNFAVKDQKSRTVKDGGSNPVWNQKFLIEVPHGPTQLDVFVFDEEKHGKDEAMGTVSIPLAKLFNERRIAPAKYPVQKPDGKVKGELELGLYFFPKTHRGILTVHLVEAHGLLETDAFGKSDPYCEIHCQGKKQKSRVLEGAGSNAVWDELFEYEVESDVTEIVIKLFDKDVGGDDALGIVTVPLQNVFSTASVPPLRYKVLGKQGQPQGEISVGLKFTPQE